MILISIVFSIISNGIVRGGNHKKAKRFDLICAGGLTIAYLVAHWVIIS